MKVFPRPRRRLAVRIRRPRVLRLGGGARRRPPLPPWPDPEDGGDGAGVREPRRPKPGPPSLAMSLPVPQGSREP